ncbi:MAG: hypothetical protein MJ054_00430, partial [Clostridia bacterium]|nr:hypothetical protein [Clostridia bacterium]
MEIKEIIKNKNIEQLSLKEMAVNFFDIFNHGLNRNLFLTYIKNNHSDLIQVLNKDGTVNKDIKYGTKEYRRYVDEYVKQHDNGPIKIFNPDGSPNIIDIVETKTIVNNDGKKETQNIIGLNKIYKEVLALYSNLENDLLKAVPPHLTKIHAGEPGYDIHKEDGYEIKYPTGSERIGFINCGQKTPGGVLGKIGRLALNGTSELSMSDA